MLIPAPAPALLSRSPMTLGQMQRHFALEIAYLYLYIYSQGYEATKGDAFRDPKLHGEMGVKKGYGHPKSNHKIRLAEDINLFKDGKWLQNTADHAIFGEWWKARSPHHVWGGDFNDGNHYSFAWQGTK